MFFLFFIHRSQIKGRCTRKEVSRCCWMEEINHQPRLLGGCLLPWWWCGHHEGKVDLTSRPCVQRAYQLLPWWLGSWWGTWESVDGGRYGIFWCEYMYLGHTFNSIMNAYTKTILQIQPRCLSWRTFCSKTMSWRIFVICPTNIRPTTWRHTTPLSSAFVQSTPLFHTSAISAGKLVNKPVLRNHHCYRMQKCLIIVCLFEVDADWNAL